MCFCLHKCMCTTCMSGALRGQKVSDSPEMELQMGIIIMQVLGMKPRPSGRASSGLNYYLTSPVATPF